MRRHRACRSRCPAWPGPLDQLQPHLAPVAGPRRGRWAGRAGGRRLHGWRGAGQHAWRRAPAPHIERAGPAEGDGAVAGAPARPSTAGGQGGCGGAAGRQERPERSPARPADSSSGAAAGGRGPAGAAGGPQSSAGAPPRGLLLAAPEQHAAPAGSGRAGPARGPAGPRAGCGRGAAGAWPQQRTGQHSRPRCEWQAQFENGRRRRAAREIRRTRPEFRSFAGRGPLPPPPPLSLPATPAPRS